MDTLTALLEGPKAKSAFLIKCAFDPPWSVRIEDRAPLSVMTMVHGSAWLLPDGGEPVLIGPGEAALVRGPDPYTLADAKDTPPQIRVGPDQRCSRVDGGEDVSDSMALGVRTWGAAEGSAVLLSGTYQDPGEIGSRLLTTLPPVLVGPVDPTLVGLLGVEISRTEPAQELVLNRLLDLLLIGVVRGWLAERAAPRTTRSPGRRCGCCTRTPRTAGPWSRWPAKSASRGPRWPAASPNWSANPRCPI